MRRRRFQPGATAAQNSSLVVKLGTHRSRCLLTTGVVKAGPTSTWRSFASRVSGGSLALIRTATTLRALRLGVRRFGTGRSRFVSAATGCWWSLLAAYNVAFPGSPKDNRAAVGRARGRPYSVRLSGLTDRYAILAANLAGLHRRRFVTRTSVRATDNTRTVAAGVAVDGLLRRAGCTTLLVRSRTRSLSRFFEHLGRRSATVVRFRKIRGLYKNGGVLC